MLDAIEAAKKAGATEAQLTAARRAAAQGAVAAGFRRGGELDGLPRPAGAARILGEAIDYARQGQLEARAGGRKK